MLCGFVVVQPVLDVMGRSPDFFLFNGAGRWEIVALAALVALVPPLVLWVVEQGAGLGGARVRHAVHTLLVGVLGGLLVIQVVKRTASVEGGPAVLAAVGGALGLAAVYVLVAGARLWLRYLSPAPVVFVALFLAVSPVSGLVLPEAGRSAGAAAGGRGTPVVVLLLDEFPLSSLLRADGTIDAGLYPNFARLAAGSTWYRNATGVSGFTPYAVPAMLTGRHPREKLAPSSSQYPDNLFTLVGDSYDMRVSESITDLCPSSVCPATPGDPGGAGMGALVEEAVGLWGDLVAPTESTTDPAATLEEETGPQPRSADDVRFLFGLEQQQPVRWTGFLDGLERSRRPSFHFLHVLLPHQPWMYLPSGLRYDAATIGKDDGPLWFDDQWPVTVSNQRLLLQVAYLDGLLGALIDRLEASGLWDKAVVVVTADHGIAFQAGDFARRASDAQAGDAMWVPFFLRAPGVPEGLVDDRNVEMVDLAPTIADLLDVKIPWEVDGRSTLGAPRTETTKSFAHRPGDPVVVDGATWFPRVLAGAVDRLLVPGDGHAGDQRERLFRLAPHGDVVGTPVDAHPVVRATGAAVHVDQAGAFDSIGEEGEGLPALVTGRLVSAGAGDQRFTVAFALNGVIAGVSEVYGDARLAAMLSETRFQPGANRLDVYLLRHPGGRVTLEPVDLR